MEEESKKKPNIGLIIALILGIPIIGFALIALVATPLINNMRTTTVNRACCLDAGGERNTDKNDCVNIENEEIYNNCLEGGN